MWGNIAIAFLLAFIVAFMATPYSIKIAKKIGAVDIPKDERRMHTEPMPKFGGAAVILGFIVSITYLLVIMCIEGSIDLFSSENYGVKLAGILAGIIIIGITGFVDDIKTIKPLVKLSGQILAAVVVVAAGIRIDSSSIPFFAQSLSVGGQALSIFVTIAWIVGITNAINLTDGLDGLSSGITLIASISLLIIFALNGSPMISMLIVTALIGAILGFLPFNFSPAKTFIGDIGSNFLGFILAIISILGVAKVYTAMVIILPVIVLGLPIIDVAWAIIRRIIKGKSLKAVFEADKGHLHHRLVAMGFTQKEAVLILYGISAACGLFAIILFESGIWKALSFLLMVMAVIGLGYKNFVKDKTEEIKK